MELAKSDVEQIEKEESSSKIPSPALKNVKGAKSVASVVNKTVSSQSKIPKRDVATFSISRRGSAIGNKPLPKPKPMNFKNSSKSLVNLNPLRLTKAPSQASTRSNLNTARQTGGNQVKSITRSLNVLLEVSVNSQELTPRSQGSTLSREKTQKPLDRVCAKKNMLAFVNVKEKVQSYQTDFMRKWELVKNELPHDEGEFKLIGLMRNNEGHLLVENGTKIKIKIAQKNLDDFKKELKTYWQSNLNRVLDSLDQALKTSSPGKIGDNSLKDSEYLSNLEEIKKKIKLNALEDVSKLIESLETAEPLKDTDLETKVSKLIKEVDECRKNLDQSQKELLRIKKDEENKEALYKKELRERDKKIEGKLKEVEELKKKIESMENDGAKEKFNFRDVQEKLKNKSKEIEDLEKKLKVSFQATEAQKARNQDLETELKVARKEVENQNKIQLALNSLAAKHAEEIKTLKGDLMSAKKEKVKLEKEVVTLRQEAEKHAEVNIQLIAQKDAAESAETEIQKLRQTVKELEAKLESLQSESSVSKDVHEELCKLQKINAEKDQNIELLEMELTKAQFQNQKLEEKIVMDRNLLRVRCNLIESLQTKEKTQKIQLQDLFTEVGDRNNDIQMLKTELLTKTEEFQNLFSTLGAKQLELTRQEHMIKLLQESNERAQTLRAKQEAKIGRLEEEIAHLKQTVGLYQNAILPNDTLRRNLLRAEANWDNEMKDNTGYYIEERRRKRHIDINVKKYEK